MYKYIKIGKILKPWKNDGVLMALLENEYLNEAKELNAIFIDIGGNTVPFFIEELDFDEEIVYIKFEEFNGPEDVKPHNGSELFIRDIDIEDIVDDDEMKFDGFTIYDSVSKQSIIIDYIEQFPEQLMAKGKLNDKEILIPLVDEFIIKIDFDKEIIKMNLPIGLLDL